MAGDWLICVDTGGTFTDLIARDPAGVRHRVKVLSTSAVRGRAIASGDGTQVRTDAAWGAGAAGTAERAGGGSGLRGCTFRLLDGDQPTRVVRDAGAGAVVLDGPVTVAAGAAFELRSPEPAPVFATRLVTGTPAGAALDGVHVRLATTRGTNALLERDGARTALFVTSGFGDLLEIGDQQRPDLFALRIERPAPLPAAVVEVDGRLDARGREIEPLDLGSVETRARALLSRGVRSAAVALLHAYRNPAHEVALETMLREAGFARVARASALAPLIKLLPRAQTAVVDAYLGPVVAGYLDDVGAAVRGAGAEPPSGRAAASAGARLHVMTSAGGLVRADAYAAKDSLLSGPAGGVAGAAAAGRRAGFDRVIGFDMGGTSTDVARYDGDFEYRFEHRVAGVRVMAPALAIHTVAAGGGSVCAFTDGRLHVGPRSAGAAPGPACYGAGGPLTLTDVNLLLGRVDPRHFAIPVFPDRAGAARDELLAAIAHATGRAPDADDVLEGLLEIANERMADAIAQVSIERGYDPADFALVAFGGAGGQHACAVAARLGVTTVLMPADASILSATGLEHAVIERFAERQVLRPLDAVIDEIPGWLDALGERAIGRVRDEDGATGSIDVRRRIANLRGLGQETTFAIDIDIDDGGDGLHAAIERAFAARYEAAYGHPAPDKPIEVESLRVIASEAAAEGADGAGESKAPRAAGAPGGDADRASSTLRARFDGAWIDCPVHDRTALVRDTQVTGPALVLDRRSAYVVESGWTARVLDDGSLLARRGPAGATGVPRVRGAAAATSDVVRQELFTNRFTSIAREMGQMLKRAAISTNVKERLDFSCALLDADGQLIVNAPHIPVHLGALGACVRAVREQIEMAPGDTIVTNHPAHGGSHLPDVTVITPVGAADGTLVGYAANRAHHAEIGGTRPGSMPPGATTLAEEGVVISPMHLVRAGVPRFDAIATLLASGPWPSRAVDDNVADLRAQVAANHLGARALAALADRTGPVEMAARMRTLAERAERVVRRVLAAWPDGVLEARETLDDGTPIALRVTVAGDTAAFDFTGSSGTHPRNLNATPAIVRSAVMYVLRLLTGHAGLGGPLNEGLMRPVTLTTPPGLLAPAFTDDPATSPAVVGGNVETSQRIVDTLLAAFDVCAGSQGTMNNVLFGDATFGYYETVGGGAGAGPGYDGASGVHTHMTNTRITDVEILEHRYPVRLERFALRRGSGGAGRHRGGDGLVREYVFGAPVSLSLLTQHRKTGPAGHDGGLPGRPGRQCLITPDGATRELESCAEADAEQGDRLVLETPGGGGSGAPIPPIR